TMPRPCAILIGDIERSGTAPRRVPGRADAPDGPERVRRAAPRQPERDCQPCGSRFGLTDVAFYRDCGLSFPTHCAACRAQRRHGRGHSELKKRHKGPYSLRKARIMVESEA